jgi:hypothetical protein
VGSESLPGTTVRASKERYRYEESNSEHERMAVSRSVVRVDATGVIHSIIIREIASTVVRDNNSRTGAN